MVQQRKKCEHPQGSTKGTTETKAFFYTLKHGVRVYSYLSTTDGDGHIHTPFVVARLRAAAKKLQIVPCLGLNAALTGTQLPKLVQRH